MSLCEYRGARRNDTRYLHEHAATSKDKLNELMSELTRARVASDKIVRRLQISLAAIAAALILTASIL
jgi:hypothetical protein